MLLMHKLMPNLRIRHTIKKIKDLFIINSKNTTHIKCLSLLVCMKILKISG